MSQKSPRKATDLLAYSLWELWCIGTVIGIWPRYIEPSILRTTSIDLAINDLPDELVGRRIVQFSDLHLGTHVSNHFLRKLSRRLNALSPDLLLFTGDFMCYSKLNDPLRLKAFLNSLSARYGCFATLGNHDYAQYAGINDEGRYGPIENTSSPLSKGFQHLLGIKPPPTPTSSAGPSIPLHAELVSSLNDTPFCLLENQTEQIKIGQSFLNISGLGDLWAGNFDPAKAFHGYDDRYPGIICSHNPDTCPDLHDYPGDAILCGHTHGGQVNLPFLRKKFLGLKNKQYRRGRFQMGNKMLYINRGVGAVFKFRWFSAPELAVITLKRSE